MKSTTIAILVFVVFTISGCQKDHYFKGVINFDMSAMNISSGKSAISGKVTTPPFCRFSKFEIELLYVCVTLYDSIDCEKYYAYYTLLNKKQNEGIKLDLVNEKLSDKIDLSIENPIGNCVAGIDIGIGNKVTINGYIDSLGTVVRTSAGGLVSDGGQSQDYVIDRDPLLWERIINKEGREPAAEADLYGIILPLDYKSGKHAVISLDNMNTIDIKWLLENAVYGWQHEWTLSSKYWATPYIEGKLDYEVYYLKRKGETRYSDIMGMLLDKDGFLTGGFLSIGQTIGWNDNNVLKTIANFGQKTDDPYDDFFKKNNDGSIYFKVTSGNGLYSTFDAFKRSNHSGFVHRDDGQVIEYDCIKAN